MNILVEYTDLAPSVFASDKDHDWSEGDSIHLALRCRHENISLDGETNGMYCPDCNNEHLSESEESEYYSAFMDEGDLSDDR